MKNFLKKLKKKKLIFVVLIILAAGLSWYLIAGRSEEEIVKTAKVDKGNVSISISVDGRTVIKRQDLAFEIGGVIRGINVKEGDVVKPWQTLAYLDVREAQKTLENTLRDYSKVRNDFEEGNRTTYDGLVVTETIVRILEKNQWDLEKAVVDVELITLARNKAYLYSSISGTVGAVNFQVGENVSTQINNPVITIVDENSFHFETYVEDLDVVKIKKDMAVRMTLEALDDEEFTGRVVFISPLAKVDSNGLATYKVTIEFDEIGESMFDGFVGEAEVISKEVVDVLKVSNTAIVREDNKSVAYVYKNGQKEKRVVELGFTDGKEVEVKSGLSLGDVVVDWK